MSLVIQNARNGKFATAKGRWTRNVREAMCFDQVLRAWEEIGERGLSCVRILLTGDDPHDSREIARAL
jgi:hypothetical protein